jgi:hypothetical protein
MDMRSMSNLLLLEIEIMLNKEFFCVLAVLLPSAFVLGASLAILVNMILY